VLSIVNKFFVFIIFLQFVNCSGTEFSQTGHTKDKDKQPVVDNGDIENQEPDSQETPEEEVVEDPEEPKNSSFAGLIWRDYNGNGVKDEFVREPKFLFVIDASQSVVSQGGYYLGGLNPGEMPEIANLDYDLDRNGSFDDHDPSVAGNQIDVNGDGYLNSRLDVTIISLINFTENIAAKMKSGELQKNVSISIILFGGQAETWDMNLSKAGIDIAESPTTDTNNNMISEVVESLLQIHIAVSGATIPDPKFMYSGQTSYYQAHTGTLNLLNNPSFVSGFGETIMVFISDGLNGEAAPWTPFRQEKIAAVKAHEKIYTIRAIAVELDVTSDPTKDDSLQEIDMNYINLTDPKKLSDEINKIPENIFEPGLANIKVFIDANSNGSLDPDESIITSAADDPGTAGTDEGGKFTFNKLPAGSYVVDIVKPKSDAVVTFPKASASFKHTLNLDGNNKFENIDFGLNYLN